MIYKKGSFNIQFFMDIMKKVMKNGKKSNPLTLGLKPQIFEQNFPAQDLNFEGDWINQGNGS